MEDNDVGTNEGATQEKPAQWYTRGLVWGWIAVGMLFLVLVVSTILLTPPDENTTSEKTERTAMGWKVIGERTSFSYLADGVGPFRHDGIGLQVCLNQEVRKNALKSIAQEVQTKEQIPDGRPNAIWFYLPDMNTSYPWGKVETHHPNREDSVDIAGDLEEARFINSLGQGEVCNWED